MLLSKLVFLCVKNVIYLDDDSFNYDGFLQEDFDSDIDYATNINNVFSPLNEAISRLNDLERIPYQIREVHIAADRTIDLSVCKRTVGNHEVGVKRVVGVAQINSNGTYKKLAHTSFGKDKIRVISPYSPTSAIFVEYKENIPVFDRTDLVSVQPDEEDENIDLFNEFGIDEGMAQFIIEYVQGKLLEPIAPELANMHITRAEAYFANIGAVQPSFPQQRVETTYKVGG